MDEKQNYSFKNKWTLYNHIKSDKDSYEASTYKICEFDNIVQFWQVFNNYPLPSKLFNNGVNRPIMNCIHGKNEITSISVFRDDILPKWEDPNNKKGAEVSKRKFTKRNILHEIDENWIDIIIASIGCYFNSSVTGVRVVDSSAYKRNEKGINEFKVLYRIELWFDDTSKREIIEDQFKKLLCIEDPKAIYYKEHS